MGTEYTTLNFEAKGDELVKKLFPALKSLSDEFRMSEERKWSRFYNLYFAYIDMTRRDPNRINYFAPFPFANIETDSAQDAKVLLGARPYFPIEPESDLSRPNVDAMSEYLDNFLDRDNFFTTAMRILKGIRVCGTWYMEPNWFVKSHIKPIKSPVGRTNINWIEERLRVRDISPWSIGVDPYSAEIPDMRWVYEMRAISRTELKRFMERDDTYKVKFEKLKERKDYGDVGNWFLDRLNFGRNQRDADMCMLIRLWLPQEGREIQLLDGEQIIKDDFGTCKIVVGRNLINPYSALHYGISDLEPVERTIHLYNDAIEHIMNVQQQQLEGVWLYREGYVDPDNLVSTGGARIPFTQPINDENFREVKSQPLSRDAYEIPDRLKNIMDEVLAKSAYNKGGQPERKETAFGIRQITEAGDDRVAAKIQTVELDAFKRLAEQCFEVIDENTTPDIEQLYLGQKAELLIYRKPDDIVGGFKWRFRGSDMMSGNIEKQNERLAIWQAVGQNTANPQEFVATIINKTNALTNEEAKKINQPPTQPMQPGQDPMAQAMAKIGMPQAQPVMGNELPKGQSAVTAGGGGL